MSDPNLEIEINPKAVTVAGIAVPGAIGRDSIRVRPIEGGQAWEVDLTLITFVPPRFVGVESGDAGNVRVADSENAK